MKYKHEDFNDYTLEESLEILREESKKRRVKADDLIIDIEEELKNQDESIAKCNELIQEIVDRLNQDNKMVCPNVINENGDNIEIENNMIEEE